MELLQLPGEIKNRIYYLACVQDAPILLRRIPIESKANTYAFANARPSLAWVCKETRKDLPPNYYEDNTFIFTAGVMSPAAILKFEQLCNKAQANITSLKVNVRWIWIRYHTI